MRQREQTRSVWLTESVLVFIVILRLYGRIFLFMFLRPGWQTASPTLSYLFPWLLFLSLLLFLSPASLSHAHMQLHTRRHSLAHSGQRGMDEVSFLSASKFKDRLLPFVAEPLQQHHNNFNLLMGTVISRGWIWHPGMYAVGFFYLAD